MGDIDQPANIIKKSYFLPLAFVAIIMGFSGGVSAEETLTQSDKKESEAVIKFNPDFIHGTAVDVSRFSMSNPTLPGEYEVLIVINGETRGKRSVKFVRLDDSPDMVDAQPCFSYEQFKKIGVEPAPEREKQLQEEYGPATEGCYTLIQWFPQSDNRYEGGEFELYLRIPQANVKRTPRGYIDPSLWDAGTTAGFIDYEGNLWSLFQGGDDNDGRASNHSFLLALNGGINLGGWQFRKRMNLNWSSNHSFNSQNLFGYVTHDITPLKSVLELGDIYSNGDIFETYGMRGLIIQTDGRMLPDSMNSYSPVINGVAETNARVRITQSGLTIYESVLPPGPFVISDLGTMGFGRDLILTVTESDGRQYRRIIPFSAPPRLLHPGISHFAVSIGELKDIEIKSHPKIVQGSYHYGLSNLWTVYGGVQIGDHYQAYGVGNAFNTPFGGLMFDIINSRSEFGDNQFSIGSSYRVNFTKFVNPTNTNLTLAAYRYSEKGYYNFREAILERERKKNNGDEYLYLRARSRFSITVAQQFTDNLTLFLSGNIYNYWGNKKNSYQYSASLSHAFKRVSYTLTAGRSFIESGKSDNLLQLTVSVPLGIRSINSRPVFSSLSNSITHSNRGGTQFQTIASGAQGEQYSLTYGIGASFGNKQYGRSVSGNLSYQTGLGQYGVVATVNDDNVQQLSLRANGSLVVHSGGLTLGPPVGDNAFAIVGVKGASGARLENGQGGRIDGNGYGIVPSLTPYKENSIRLDPRNLPITVDVLENEKTVVPRRGAIIAINMSTITGKPMILTLRDKQLKFLPIGSELEDSKGVDQGIVGQGGQAFVRGWQPLDGPLVAKFNGLRLICNMEGSTAATLVKTTDTTEITQLEVTCVQSQK